MKIPTLLLTVVLFGVCGSAMAQWQWLDKDGRKVFSDRSPPPDVPEKNILKRPGGAVAAPAPSPVATEGVDGAAAPAKAPAPSGVDKDLEAKKKQLEKQAADADAAKRKTEEDRITKAKMESCTLAKQAMDNLNSGVRMSRVNASGEREILDDAARAAEGKRIQAIISSDCR